MTGGTHVGPTILYYLCELQGPTVYYFPIDCHVAPYGNTSMRYRSKTIAKPPDLVVVSGAGPVRARTNRLDTRGPKVNLFLEETGTLRPRGLLVATPRKCQCGAEIFATRILLEFKIWNKFTLAPSS